MAANRKKRTIIKELSRAFVAVWQNKLWLIFLVGVTIVFTAWHNAMSKQNFAEATLVLRYEQAYEGLNPNGTRFNINELMSEEVLAKTIEKAGLAGILSTDELLDSMSVSASGSHQPKDMYIATEYSVRVSNKYLPKQITPRNILLLLMETYRQYFLAHYGSNDSALNINWSDTDDWEYLEFADIMSVKVNNLITYLDDLREESGMYQYHTEGESFRSLSESISNFKNIYLNKYTSYVTINHLFKNPSSYRSKLKYRRFLTEQNLKNNEDRYEIYQDALKIYDESMITFVMVPMYDGSKGLYMARTSIGMDALTEESKSYAEKIETNAKEIKTFDLNIENTDKTLGTGKETDSQSEKYAFADQMIKEIQNHLDNLIRRIQVAKKEYEDYRDKNSIHYSIKSYSIFSGYDIKNAVICGALVGLFCVLFYLVRDYYKQEKSL